MPHGRILEAGTRPVDDAAGASDEVRRVDDGVYIDDECWPARANGRVGEIEELGLLGQLFLHARRALRSAPVVNLSSVPDDERDALKKSAFLDCSATRGLWSAAREVTSRWRLDAVWAVDGAFYSRPTHCEEEKPGTAGRAAVRHDGRAVQSRLGPGDADDAYMTELAAQLDACGQDGQSREIKNGYMYIVE